MSYYKRETLDSILPDFINIESIDINQKWIKKAIENTKTEILFDEKFLLQNEVKDVFNQTKMNYYKTNLYHINKINKEHYFH